VSNLNGENMGKKAKSISTAAKKPDTYSVPEAGRIVGLGKNASYDAARRGELNAGVAFDISDAAICEILNSEFAA
jgi:hypothetical protein